MDSTSEEHNSSHGVTFIVLTPFLMIYFEFQGDSTLHTHQEESKLLQPKFQIPIKTPL